MKPLERIRPPEIRLPGTVAALAFLLFLSPPAGAKETDSFTHRFAALAFPAGEVDGRPIRDFTDEFNDQFGRVFAESLEQINLENRRAGLSCGSDRARRRLYERVSDRLGGPLFLADNRLRPALTAHPNRLPAPEKRDSIYRDFRLWGSITLGVVAKLGHNMASQFRFDLVRVLVAGDGSIARAPDGRLVVLGPDGVATERVFNLRQAAPRRLEHGGETYYLLEGGQALVEKDGAIRRVMPILVSSDKISHFFNRSLGLFKRLGGGSPAELDRVLARNRWLEASYYGSKSTGVAAYGDLVANFQGMRFWVHLLGRGWDGRPLADPLATAPPPLVGCTDAGWAQRRAFDIADYLDPAWDEALNCSLLRSRRMARMVRRRTDELSRQDEHGRDYTCPVDRGLIAETATVYGRFVPEMINTKGHDSLRSR